jgi:hypothetical protein
MFFSFGNSGSWANDITFFYFGSSLNFQVNNGADGGASLGYTIGSWSHISIVYDGTQSTDATRLKVYLNGVQQVLAFSYTVPATTSNVNFSNSALGVYTTQGFFSNNMAGNIGTASLYNRALSAAEIKQNFNAQNDRFGLADIP